MLPNDVQRFVNENFPGVACEVDGRRVIYLDNAATTLKPRQMIDAVCEYYSGISSNVHRGKHVFIEEVSNRYEHARYKVAELLGCSGNEVVFTRNTTESMNIVARGLDLGADDSLIVCNDAHHSNYLPWLSEAKVHTVRTGNDGLLDINHYYELLKKRPRLVAITHCSNVNGVYLDLEPMVSAARGAGAIVVVDAAQSVPHRRINVHDLGVDFLAFSAHKMAGPTGLGVLYGRKERLNELKPFVLGGGMVDWVENGSYRLRKIPHRFEAGTPNIAAAYGLAASIDVLHTIGFDILEKHDSYLARVMLEQASHCPYVKVLGDGMSIDRGAVLSMKVGSEDKLDDLARMLSDSYGIMCRSGHLCAQPYVSEHGNGQVLRISGYVYTTEDDVKNFFNALNELGQFMFA